MRNFFLSCLQFLHGVLLLTGILAGLSAIFSLFEPDQPAIFIRCLVVFIPFVVTAIAEKYAKHLLTFLLLSVASLAAVFYLAATVPEKVLLLLTSVAVIAIRIWSRVREEGIDPFLSPQLGVLGIFVVLYIVGIMTVNQLMADVNYYVLFAYTILIIIYKNMVHLDGYLEYNSSVENIPVRQIRKNNFMIMIVFMTLTVIMMILIPKSGLDGAASLLGKGLLGMVGAFLRLFSSESEPPQIIEEAAESSGQADPSMFSGAVETPAWVTALYNSLALVLFILIICLALGAAAAAIYRLFKKFYRPSMENDDETVFLEPVRSIDTAGSAGTPHRPLWLSFDPNAVVRKQYRRMILRQKKPVDRSSYTPVELEELVGVPESEKRDALHRAYEKARYSEHGVTKEDVQALKN